jgi:serine/threonine-protein kinase
MQAYLRVVAGPDTGRTIELSEGGKLTIGRAEKSDTRLHDVSVERLHCELRWDEGKFHLVDLESVSGTMVDGQKITELDLKHGQEFQVGHTRFKLLASGMADTKEPGSTQQKAARELKPDATVLTGKTISHFELGPLVATGRTGTVYKARDLRDNKEVAFKVLHSDFASNAEDVQRFVKAMTTAVDLRHPNLIPLYAAGKQGNSCWFATEYVDGEPLTKLIEKLAQGKQPDWRFALKVGVQIARALEAAHKKQLIHRNIAPQNILIRKQDKVAKLSNLRLTMALEGIKSNPASNPGALVGDVVYMAPERTKNDGTADTRADIYGLGATLYALLTGKPPFQGKTLVETIAQIRGAEPVPPKKIQSAIPDKFQDAVMIMLAKRPELRYQSPAQAARALEKVAKDEGMTV